MLARDDGLAEWLHPPFKVAKNCSVCNLCKWHRCTKDELD